MAEKTTPKRKRFADLLTEEQRQWLRDSAAEAEAERPDLVIAGKRYAANMELVNAEIGNAFRLLMSLRAARKIPWAVVAEATGLTTAALKDLETNPEAFVSLETLAGAARAIGATLRIAVTEERAKPRRRKMEAV